MNAVVLGLGRIGNLLEGEPYRASPCTHAGCFEAHDQTELVGGFDPDAEACELFLKRYPNALTASQDLISFLLDLRPELVSVAASSGVHLELIEALHAYQLQTGALKGILLEKPVGMDVDEAMRVLEFCDQMGVSTIVCHDRRFYPEFLQLKSMLHRRGLGKLRHFRAELCCGSYAEGKARSAKKIRFGGPLLHDGTHLMDFFLWMKGLPHGVSAIAQRHHPKTITEDTVTGTFFWDDGLSASFLVGGRRKYFRFQFEVEWEKARYSWSDGRIEFYRKEKGSWLLVPSRLNAPKAANPYMVRLDHLLDVISGKTLPKATILDGIVALSMIEAAYLSSENMGAYVPLKEEGAWPGSLMVGKPDKNR